MFCKNTIEEFNKNLASNSPAPGGGSVAALLGALSSSLCSMMASLTVSKKGYEEYWDNAQVIIDRMEVKANYFHNLIDKDASSFDGVIAAFKLPKETEEERAFRKQKIQDGYKLAISIPIETAESTLSLFEDIQDIVKNGNKNVVTDGLAAAITARAAIETALLNVKINLGSVKDESYKEEINSKIKFLEKESKKNYNNILSLATF